MKLKVAIPLIVINLVLLIAFAYAGNSLFVQARGLRFDFYPHYVGGQAVWQGQIPYDRAITEQIQLGMFDTLLPPEADQQNVAYPAYSSIVLAPFLVFPAEVAISLWIGFQFLCLFWTPLIWLMITGWRPAPLVLGVLMFGVIFVFRYPIDTLSLAQFSGSIVFALSLGVLLLVRGHPIFAGVVMTLATIPPTLGAPLAIAILLAVALRGRWKGLAAFAVTMAMLTGISFILIGFWVPDYLDILNAYQGYADFAWNVQTLGWLPAQVVFVVALVGLSLMMLWRYLQTPDTDKLIDLTVTALIVSLNLIPVTGEYYLVLLIPAMIVILWRVETRRVSTRAMTVRIAVWISITAAIFSPWLFRHGDPLATLISPVHILLTWLLVYFTQNRQMTTTRVSTKYEGAHKIKEATGSRLDEVDEKL